MNARSNEPTTFDVYGYRGVHWECLRCGRFTDDGIEGFCRDCWPRLQSLAWQVNMPQLFSSSARAEWAVWWDEMQTRAPVVVPRPFSPQPPQPQPAEVRGVIGVPRSPQEDREAWVADLIRPSPQPAQPQPEDEPADE